MVLEVALSIISNIYLIFHLDTPQFIKLEKSVIMMAKRERKKQIGNIFPPFTNFTYNVEYVKYVICRRYIF